MAYLHQPSKTIILFPHKTGTWTIRQMLKDAGKIATINVDGINNHPSLDQLIEESYPNFDLTGYAVFAFYREPVRRFISWVGWVYRQNPDLPMANNVMEHVETYGRCVPQTRWLVSKYAEINLLDFRNFESELRTVLDRIGVPSNVIIPVLNAADEDQRVNYTLTQEETDFIKNLYLADYDLLSTKGITFP